MLAIPEYADPLNEGCIIPEHIDTQYYRLSAIRSNMRLIELSGLN